MIKDILGLLLFVFTVLATGVFIIFLLQQSINILVSFGIPGWITGFISGFIVGANRSMIINGCIGFCASAWDHIHTRIHGR